MSSPDTVRLGIMVPHQEIDFAGWIRKKTEIVGISQNRNIGETLTKNIRTQKGALLKLKYIPFDYQGKVFDLLIIEFSLPKVHYGVNYLELDNWEPAYNSANQVIASIPGLPKLPDIRDWTLYRIDLCHNHHVGKHVFAYIEALLGAHFPHRKRKPYKPNGVIFSSNEISTCFYDKFEECSASQASGILRQETRIQSKRKLGKIFGKEEITLRDITPDKVKNILQHDLEILQLDKPIHGNELKIGEILSAQYKPLKVSRLIGYMLIKNTSTNKQMISKGYKSHTISRYEKEISEAGISSLSMNERQELPALIISIKKCNKVLSDTKS